MRRGSTQTITCGRVRRRRCSVHSRSTEAQLSSGSSILILVILRWWGVDHASTAHASAYASVGRCPMAMDNQTVVILGGSSGIGLATAQAAVAEGAQVLITGRSRETLDLAAAQIGKGARAVQLDSADEKGMSSLFDGLPSVD